MKTRKKKSIRAAEAPSLTPLPGQTGDTTSTGGVHPEHFINRELSWLEFNRRVLHEACEPRTPLLERLRFLGIFTSNLDEFFMKRVGGLKRQIIAGVVRRSAEGMTPRQQLTAIREKVIPLLRQQAECFTRDIRPALEKHHIVLADWEQLSREQQDWANAYFRSRVFPVLTPLAVDPGHPFPFISNLSTSLGIALRYPHSEDNWFARVKIPEVLPQWIKIEEPKSSGHMRYVSLIDMIRHNVNTLFPEMHVTHVMTFRVTRNADVERDEEDAEDLLELIEEEVRRRRFEKVVRLEHGPCPDPWLLRYLVHELDLTDEDVYETSAELDYTSLNDIADLNLPALRYDAWTPLTIPSLNDDQRDIFSVIRVSDILVHHPYEDFSTSVERFVRTAVDDPNVLAIKMIIYRTGDDSPFMRMLIRAAEAGKQVVCLVELKARFDEERNIYWAQLMEKAGIHVVYGLVGLKIHAKIALVVREESEGVRCYAHIATGNYHVQTARLYTDLGLFTCKPEFMDDLVELFNYLTGRSLKREYRKLLVAPINMRDRFLNLIHREIQMAKAGRPAQIIAKMNSLEDDMICQALYCASQAGVSVDLIVRGFCCLKPGVPALSDNIRVTSVIGRFLEHSRIFFFRNGAEDPINGDFFIGSADWMYRNLLARVEVVTPIEHRLLRERCWEILQIMLRDNRQAWDMKSDGSYVQRHPSIPSREQGTHQVLMNLTRQRILENK